MTNTNYFKLNIRYLRKTKNFSQGELGIEFDEKRVTISAWEQGKSYPPADKLITIAKMLDVALNDLLLTDMELESGQDKQPTENTKERYSDERRNTGQTEAQKLQDLREKLDKIMSEKRNVLYSIPVITLDRNLLKLIADHITGDDIKPPDKKD